jgi:hypothetical protein
LRDEEDHARRLFELFRAPRHVLLLFLGAAGNASEKSEHVASAITGFPDDAFDLYRIARGESAAAAELRDLTHAAYGLSDGGVVVVRPDGYIAFRSDDFDPAELRSYLARILILPPPGSAAAF